jgi:hypothetical protein
VEARDLIGGLLAEDAYPHPVKDLRVVETHISWVLLTGDYAYKLKRPVSLGFLDFTTLAERRFYCDEELRLNTRMAPELYLDVVPITGSVEHPVVGGGGEPIEYAVKMVQFPDSARLDRRLESGGLSVEGLRRFAESLAHFHATADRRESDHYGGPGPITKQMLANLEQLEPLLDPAERARLPQLLHWTRTELGARHEQLSERAALGMVRECHGDLHLSNLVSLASGIVAFDCIEFDPALRWIDVIDDVGFLMMDLELRGRNDLAYAFADSYLAATGDYEGGRLLDLYRVYRSVVRAKVAAVARRQSHESPQDGTGEKIQRHLQLANRYLAPHSPILVLMHGLSGSGKSWLAGRLAPRLPGLRVSSDLERKRLAGLASNSRSNSPVGAGLYSASANQATYARLAELARGLIDAGHHVIVDAAFLTRVQREDFYALARSAGAPCVVIECAAPRETLEQRITARAAKPSVSEADHAVLNYQTAQGEPVVARDENAIVLRVDTTGETDPVDLAARILDEVQ